jgi:hypothetical protein
MGTEPSGFLEYLCAAYPRVLMLHLFLWAGLVLNTVLALADLPPAAEVVTGLNYVGLIAMLAGSGAVLWKCRSE